jgi:hypothetical protein
METKVSAMELQGFNHVLENKIATLLHSSCLFIQRV